VFADIRQFVSLATYNADYDPEDEGASGNANIMEGVTTTNADIWPGGHGTAGWTNGSTVTVVSTTWPPAPDKSAEQQRSRDGSCLARPSFLSASHLLVVLLITVPSQIPACEMPSHEMPSDIFVSTELHQVRQRVLGRRLDPWLLLLDLPVIG
jgi:hypothetical protein